MELKFVKGVSAKRTEDLAKMNIFTAEDLTKHFPRAYLDLTHTVSLREAVHNDFALIKAEIITKPNSFRSANKRSFVKVAAEQDGEIFNIFWFNQPYVADKLEVGETYLFYGRIRNRFGLISMTNPSFELLEKNAYLRGIVPVYSIKSGLSQKVMRSIIHDAISKVKFESAIPPSIVRDENLMELDEAYQIVHNPLNFDECAAASERIALEELFGLITAFKIIKGDKEQARVNRYGVSGRQVAEFSKRFGFELTVGQKKAVNDIFTDLCGPKVMNRLLQGDVGSGKTAVALCALYMAAASGFQSVMLSPTEVLAKQNYELIAGFLPEFKIAFLSGSTSAKEKTAVKNAIKKGEIDIVCGTHAVLEGSVEFKNLCLAVCDEQHRFGVSQRSNLVAKGKACDVLVMSATPIPRTLSLIFYGDLDVSTIVDKPKARAEIKTSIVPQEKYALMLDYIKKEIERGRQAFFVCPKIEGDPEGSMISVKEIYDELTQKLPTLRLEMLHGKMKDKEKTEIMLDFKARKIDALISTTVIEVGIDVPNATVMVIYGADRFGLSQLHQLRGRVGRGSAKSYCFLLSDNENDTADKRLSVLCENSDGFKIAEADFEERGSGDFMGTRQSGKTIGNLGALRYSASTIFRAKKFSDAAFSDPKNVPALKRLAYEKYESLKDVTLN